TTFALKHRNRCNTPFGPECSRGRRKLETDYAFASGTDGFGCGGRAALGGEPDTHARNDQVHFKRRSGDRGGDLAIEYFWIHAFAGSNARRSLSASVEPPRQRVSCNRNS